MSESIKKILKDERHLAQLATAGFMETDVNKSGHIDDKDIPKTLAKTFATLNCPKPSAADLKDLLKKLNRNLDGKLTLDEYITLIKNFLKKSAKTLEDESENNLLSQKKLEEAENQIKKQLGLFEKYIQESGISIAFQIIFTEIISKKIDPDNAFTYTAMRLRQIGKEVEHLLPQNFTKKLIEN
jgi:EF-hand domain pair